jgi:predicted permease
VTISRFLRILRKRYRSLFHKQEVDAEIGGEFAFHLHQLVEEYTAEGMPIEEARLAARRALGNSAVFAEECRDQQRTGWLHDVGRDIRFGARMAHKNPGFTCIAALSLALCIGANTAILGVWTAVTAGPLPYRDPESLVAIRTYNSFLPLQAASLPEYIAWRERQRSFSSMGASLANQADLEDAGGAEHLYGRLFSPELFATLGVQPAMGRLFLDEEYEANKNGTVVVITHRLWQNRFGTDPDIIGRQIRLNSALKTVVGVLPAYFPYSEQRVDYYIPFVLRAPRANTERFFQVTARLRPGVTIEQAQADMDAIARDLEVEFPDRNQGWRVRVQPIREFLFDWTRQPLWTLELAVVLVLLIACANIAGLLLARGSARQHEISMRVALGAGRGRIVRQLLTESLMIAFAGGALGVVVADISLYWVPALTPPPGSAPLAGIALDPRLFAINGLTSILTGLIFGLAPALTAFRSGLGTALKQSAAHLGEHGRKLRMRGILVVTQVAVAVVLLAGTGLLLKSAWRLAGRELNFEPEGMLSFEVRVPAGTFMEQIGTYRDWNYFELKDPPRPLLESIRERVAAMPEVASVAGSSNPPVNSLVLTALPVRAEDDPDPGGSGRPAAVYLLITPGFFSTIRAQVIGREFDDRDSENAPWVAVVNETAARQLWPGSSSTAAAIGRKITLDATPDERPRTVVGVVRDIPTRANQTAPRAIVYAPYAQQPSRTGPWGNLMGQMTYMVRLRGDRDPMTFVDAVRRAAAEVAPDRPISNIAAVSSYMSQRQGGLYLIALAAFAMVAVLLAAIGVYGVISFDLHRRTREIGVRMALGASPLEVVSAVGGRAFALVAIGLVCGLAGAAALGQLLTPQLWQVAPQDPPTLLAALLLVALVAAGACFGPARRGLRLDPTITLRCE